MVNLQVKRMKRLTLLENLLCAHSAGCSLWVHLEKIEAPLVLLSRVSWAILFARCIGQAFLKWGEGLDHF
jgi:hypothetical protein